MHEYASPEDPVTLPDMSDDDEVWRRVPPEKVVFDASNNTFRPSKDSFNDSPNKSPMSAFLAKECMDPALALEGHEGFALVGVRIALLREKNLVVTPAPEPDLPPGHVHIVGRKTDSVRKALAKNCKWVVEPSDAVKQEAKEKASG
jgi:hypothetical protein